MNEEYRRRLAEYVADFHLPRYRELPDIGLHLEQVTRYASRYVPSPLTGSMVSNYVKKGILASPVRKQYGREQIAHLIYITVVKSVLPREDIRLMLSIQKRTYDSAVAYDYFCTELENVLDYVFGRKPEMDAVGVERTAGEKLMLRNTIITVAHKVYLTRLCAVLREQEERTHGQKTPSSLP